MTYQLNMHVEFFEHFQFVFTLFAAYLHNRFYHSN